MTSVFYFRARVSIPRSPCAVSTSFNESKANTALHRVQNNRHPFDAFLELCVTVIALFIDFRPLKYDSVFTASVTVSERVCGAHLSFWLGNSPFPSCCLPGFQRESWFTTIQMEWVVYFHANQTHYHLDGLAPRLVLNQKQTATRNWPISIHFFDVCVLTVVQFLLQCEHD